MDVYGFLWIPMDSYGFLWIPVDFYGFLWIPMDSYGFLFARVGKSKEWVNPETETTLATIFRWLEAARRGQQRRGAALAGVKVRGRRERRKQGAPGLLFEQGGSTQGESGGEGRERERRERKRKTWREQGQEQRGGGKGEQGAANLVRWNWRAGLTTQMQDGVKCQWEGGQRPVPGRVQREGEGKDADFRTWPEPTCDWEQNWA
jgi:hypothetical protein